MTARVGNQKAALHRSQTPHPDQSLLPVLWLGHIRHSQADKADQQDGFLYQDKVG